MDDDFDELDDRDDPADADMDHDDSTDTVPCPACGENVYEKALICPRCGQYIPADSSAERKPMWIIIVAGICIVVILLAWVATR